MEPSAIESAIPSLPSMRGGVTPPFRTSRPSTSAQMGGAADGRVVGRGEATRSAVSGKSLARGATNRRDGRHGAARQSEGSRSDQTSQAARIWSYTRVH
jgi:hypothetical protein